ncbi:hypothetical protein HRI_001421800 [Hibiscus trionum]|uniref:THH1/TOM1/TOM3 domain-containing protein n=1 Tax=Hibiscus trionum TaxID=183268 RepID=A0A9W7LWE1_HIBTR|nr:hypothetical protein HRI_001421800 [Hibiscus trionum]
MLNKYNWKFVFEGREANRDAHILAKNGVTRDVDFSWDCKQRSGTVLRLVQLDWRKRATQQKGTHSKDSIIPFGLGLIKIISLSFSESYSLLFLSGFSCLVLGILSSPGKIPLDLTPMEFPAMVSSWWDEINESTHWQDGIFYTLCAAYALVSFVALIQLIRIELRVPEYSWTMQKVFHLMNVIANGVRAVVFGFHKQVFVLHPKVLMFVLLDLPDILFFSTYTLLVLFWAEIYHQARSLPTDKLRISFVAINGVVYVIQVCIWVFLWIDDNGAVEFIGKIFIAVVSFIAALGFLLYGGRLFLMLRSFPIESKGRRNKLHEVGSVTAISFACFLIRCCVVVLSAFDSNASLDVLDHPVLNLIYYTLAEILPSALVLYILRKLPPKRISSQYHPIC